MIDPADKQTASLPLEQPKRGRGRPTTGEALTPAQKQKAYRERQKQLLAEAQNLEAMSRVQEGLNADAESQIRLVSKLLDQERENSERLAKKVIELERQLKELKKSNVTEKEYEQMLKMLDEANKEKKYWIDRALKKGAESTKPPFELQYKSHNGRWVKGAYQEDMYDQLMTKEAAEALRARMQKATDDDPTGTLTWRIKELK